MKKYLFFFSLLLTWAQFVNSAPITSMLVSFVNSSREFTANSSTNTDTNTSGQIWVQVFPSPDAGETITLEVLRSGVVQENAITPASFTTQAGIVTYGTPAIIPLPITFFKADTGLVIRARAPNGTTATSATFNVSASTATRLLVLAPGMSYAPGQNPSVASGFTGTPSTQDPESAFSLSVVLTDDSFNQINRNDVVSFASGDLTTLPSNAALSAGTGNFNVSIDAPRTTRSFTVSNLTDTSVTAGAVTVTTTGPPEEEIFPFPSPFNPQAGQNMTFRFRLTAGSSVKIKVVDMFGQSVWDRKVSAGAGFTDISWNGQNDSGVTVAAGVYYAILEVGGSIKSRRKFGVIK